MNLIILALTILSGFAQAAPQRDVASLIPRCAAVYSNQSSPVFSLRSSDFNKEAWLQKLHQFDEEIKDNKSNPELIHVLGGSFNEQAANVAFELLKDFIPADRMKRRYLLRNSGIPGGWELGTRLDDALLFSYQLSRNGSLVDQSEVSLVWRVLKVIENHLNNDQIAVLFAPNSIKFMNSWNQRYTKQKDQISQGEYKEVGNWLLAELHASMSRVEFWALVENTFSKDPQIIGLIKNRYDQYVGLDDKTLALAMAGGINSLRVNQGQGPYALEALFEAATKYFKTP